MPTTGAFVGALLVEVSFAVVTGGAGDDDDEEDDDDGGEDEGNSNDACAVEGVFEDAL